MGGRSPVAWLVAVAVAMGFVGPLAFAPASAQISVPLPGTDSRPRVVERKQIFRPTAPYRNPNRVAASIAAVAAPSTSSVSGAVAASAAGGLSAASGALKADPTVIARTYATAEAPADTAAPSGETEADVSASDEDGIDTADASEESSSDDPAPDVAAEESTGDESEATDVATADDAATSESEDAEAASDQGEAALASEDTKPASEPQDTADTNASAETATQSDDAGTDEPTADVNDAPSGKIMLAASTTESAEDPAGKADDKETGDATDVDSAQAKAGEPEEPAATESAASSDDIEPIVTEATDNQPADAETAEAQEADQEPEAAEVADTPSDETTATDSTPVEADDAEASPSESETADAEPAEPTDTKTAESEEPAQEAVTVETAEASPDDTAAIESEPAETAETETASAPSHDATVVLEVSPPPDEVIVAALTPADAETSSNDAAAEEPEEPEDVAALTPPSGPEPELESVADPATESETPTAAEPESDSDDTAADPEEPRPEEAAETPASDDAPTDADPATATSEEAEEGETPDETVMEPAPPPPPPAHPIVATVRDALAAPDAGKSVASADLEALKTFYGSHEGPPLWVTQEGFTPKAQAIITEIEKADEWGLDAGSFELPPPNDLLATPNAHADDELQLSVAILSYARDAQIGRLSPSKVSKLFDQHPSLRDPKTVLTEIAAADDPSAYLVSLHPQHEQFKRLRAALVKARASADAKGSNPRNDPEVQRIAINMERWRWMPRNLGAFHIWNNIPEFNVRVVKNGKTVYLESTIVGQLKYATVFFSAPMRNIVFHPDWTVPPTIVKEDLAPKLEQGGGGFFSGGPAAALRRHGLSASLAGQPVDANAVDWKNENIHRYTFTQAPGPANVLGKLKFNFPNRHAIYMHDTIQPELFSEPVRTLSHGCIRVREPDRFAALLLGEDKGWSHAQVRGLLATNETSVVSLSRHIPVHLTYFTAVVDENGKLNTFGDIYGLDNRMAASLFDNPARFHVPPTPAVVDAAPRTQRRQGGGGLDGIISGLFGN